MKAQSNNDNRKRKEKEENEIRGEREYIDMSSTPSDSSPEIADRANLLYDETAGEAFSGDAMGEQGDVNPVSDINSFEDPLEADINERLKLGFALEKPEENNLGDESEYIGDLPEESMRPGNRYYPSLSTGTTGTTGLEMPGDLEMHVKGENDIGMAYGPDKYVDDSGDYLDLPEDDDEAENQSIH